MSNRISLFAGALSVALLYIAAPLQAANLTLYAQDQITDPSQETAFANALGGAPTSIDFTADDQGVPFTGDGTEQLDQQFAALGVDINPFTSAAPAQCPQAHIFDPTIDQCGDPRVGPVNAFAAQPLGLVPAGKVGFAAGGFEIVFATPVDGVGLFIYDLQQPHDGVDPNSGWEPTTFEVFDAAGNSLGYYADLFHTIDLALDGTPGTISQGQGITRFFGLTSDVPIAKVQINPVDHFEPESPFTLPAHLSRGDYVAFDQLEFGFLPVTNQPPTIDTVTPAASAVAIDDQPVAATVAFTDPDGSADVSTCQVDFDGDGPLAPVPGTIDVGTSTCTASFTYAEPGLYSLSATVDDQAGESASGQGGPVAVYDPTAGFITGGGWFRSPAGAWVAQPNHTGKALFGFVAKYKNNSRLKGHTVFRLKWRHFNFYSTTYDWLVINGTQALLSGSGKVNGTDGYTFHLVADAHDDRIRLRIADASGVVVYDTQMGAALTEAPSTDLRRGHITIHRGRQNSHHHHAPQVLGNSPNPFNPNTTIHFSLPEAAPVTLKVFNIQGQLVATLAEDQPYTAGSYAIEFNAEGLASGLYFYHLQAGAFKRIEKMTLMK